MRQRVNLFLNEIVRLFLHSHPDLRYIQALFALGIIDKGCGQTLATRWDSFVIDRFYEEPIDTLKRCRERITKFLEEKYPDKVVELNRFFES